MDEYLFIEMAKLKADREKLAQTQQEQTKREHEAQRTPPKGEREAPSQILVPLLSWR